MTSAGSLLEPIGEEAQREVISAAAGMAGTASGLEEEAAEAVDAVAGAVEGAESRVVDEAASGDGPATPGTTRPDPQLRPNWCQNL